MPFTSRSKNLNSIREQNRYAAIVIKCVDIALDNRNIDLEKIKNEVSKLKNGKKLIEFSPKLDLEFKEEIKPSVVDRVMSYQKDRSFKLDTIKIGEFSREHDKEIHEATIHLGMSADEYARTFNALALTIGRDIFFRNGAYKPETEEGRKLLAHELTHVSQNENKEDNRHKDKAELEQEALQEEEAESYSAEKQIDYIIGNKVYKLTERQIKEIEKDSMEYLEKWVIDQENILSDKDYLDLLLKYEKYEETKR